jgi:hypothetical protein
MTTDDFTEGTKFRKREKVNQFAYCGLNPMYRAYMSFDLDFPGAARRFEDIQVPVPTIITTNRANGHCHYLYRLVTPVAFHEKSRSEPQDYFEALQDEMTRLLKADFAFTHTLTKNPLHNRWIVETFSAQYHLSDFTEYFDLPNKQKSNPLPDACVIQGRNDKLFHTLRYWAYRQVVNHASEESLFAALLHQAGIINADFSSPLAFNEVRDTAKSMSKWVWKRRNDLGSATRNKVLTFTDETVSERMQAGAAYTNQQRCEKSTEILRAAVQDLLPLYSRELSPKVLAAHTGQNIKTVRKYLPGILSKAGIVAA